jgi:hypothetical protein
MCQAMVSDTRVLNNAVGKSGALGEPRDFGGLGPASREASEIQGAAPLPPRTGCPCL